MQLRLDTGEPITAKSFDGNVLVLHAPMAFAPGSPIRFLAVSADPPRAFEGRTIGSKRIMEGAFEVKLRLINLRKEDRLFLRDRF